MYPIVRLLLVYESVLCLCYCILDVIVFSVFQCLFMFCGIYVDRPVTIITKSPNRNYFLIIFFCFHCRHNRVHIKKCIYFQAFSKILARADLQAHNALHGDAL